MKITLSDLRHHAIANSLFPPTSLRRAVERLGFVQADPIRAPARAQDLILRHRVKHYRVGDLEAKYHQLGFEEDFLYAYGFMPRATWNLIHPRAARRLTVFEQRVLDVVSRHERVHPRELEAYLGRKRRVNGWGGYSKATTHALHRLHYRGHVRVAGRDKGIRLYAPSVTVHEPGDAAARLQQLVLLLVTILAPLPERSFPGALYHLSYVAPATKLRMAATRLLDSGKLATDEVDGVPYHRPAGPLLRREPEEAVRFLAPFDPLVWDRGRFEQFWGWSYRFEAYTPLAKRKLGYYALPLLWKADVIGWVNIAREGENITIKPGFVRGNAPSSRAFKSAFDAEVERFRVFLRPRAIGREDD